jgi:hypothetical protein
MYSAVGFSYGGDASNAAAAASDSSSSDEDDSDDDDGDDGDGATPALNSEQVSGWSTIPATAWKSTEVSKLVLATLQLLVADVQFKCN